MTLSPLRWVILAAASIESYILFAKLPRIVQEYVGQRLRQMAENESVNTEFGRALVEMNPAPDRVTNHFKWRATQPVRVRLKIPRVQLEMDIVRTAYPERDLTNVDLSGMVYHLRAIGDEPSLIDLMEQVGIEGIQALVRQTYPRISAFDLNIRNVVNRYRRYTYNPIQRIISERS